MKINKQILLDKLKNQDIPTGSAKVLYDWEPTTYFPTTTYIYNNLFDAADHSNASGINAQVKPGFNVGSTDYPIGGSSTGGSGRFVETDLIGIGSKVEYDNWTAFINFNEALCGNRTNKQKSRILLSSMQDPIAESGFILGVNGSNKLFYEYIDTSGIRQSKTLDKVLGEKNLISVGKSKGSSKMTLGVYDPIKNVGTYKTYNILEGVGDQRWYIGGTFTGLYGAGGASNSISDNYKGFDGYIDNFFLLDGYWNQEYLRSISDIFFLTGYNKAENTSSSYSYNVATGYKEELVAEQAITGYQLQAVNVDNGPTVYEEVPLYGNVYKNKITYLTDPSASTSASSTVLQSEAKSFDYPYIKGYAYPCVLWDSSFDTASTYELYSCDVYTNRINVKAKYQGGFFTLDKTIYTGGENVNIYVDGKIQESGVDYDVISILKISGMNSGYTRDNTVVYDVITGTQYWWPFTGWQGTMTLVHAHDKDLYLDKLKLVSGVDYAVSLPTSLDVYATNLPTGIMSLIPRHDEIRDVSTSTIGNHGKCFSHGLISEQIWVDGSRNAEGVNYTKKTSCDISCADPDGTLSSFVSAKTHRIFETSTNINITGTHMPRSSGTTTLAPTLPTGVAPTTTTTTTSAPQSLTFYYGWDCYNANFGNIPLIVKFLDGGNVLTGSEAEWPIVVKLDDGTCVSNLEQETALISESTLPNTNGETFEDSDLFPTENTACKACLGFLPTTTTLPGTTTTPGPICKYVINASLDWDSLATNRADLDVYVWTNGGCDSNPNYPEYTDVTVYWGNMSYIVTDVNGDVVPDNHMSLNRDAHPICFSTPEPPETISGTFTENREFKVWWNQHSICTSQASAPIQKLSVENTGDFAFQVNGTTVNIGETYWIINTEDSNVGGTLAYAGYGNGDQSAFQSGTAVSITGCPACE